jgi:DNA-binding NarL/FixJ family response regulator
VVEYPVGVRVLLVDDSAIIRRRLFDLIAGARGIESVDEAESVSTALDLAHRHAIDLAVVDISLGSESGLDLLRLLRAEHPQMLLVVLTNNATQAHRDECSRRGAQYFFDKSLEFEQAVALVSGVAAAYV